jgi:hypothetical protein
VRSVPFGGVLLAMAAQGLFHGGFFSLMPVMLSQSVSSNTTFANGADVASEDSAPVIAVVIIAAGVLQIINNLAVIRPSLRRFGSLGHIALSNVAGTALLLLSAALITVGAGQRRDGATVALLGSLFAVEYVATASSLTVLNQIGTLYARRYGAPIGTVTGISRSVFSTFFGVAPAASIGMYAVAPWLPLVVMALLTAVSALYFGCMLRSGDPDPIPRGIAQARAPQRTSGPMVDKDVEATRTALPADVSDHGRSHSSSSVQRLSSEVVVRS